MCPPRVPIERDSKWPIWPNTVSIVGFNGLIGEPPGNRTPNLLIKSQLLCQLS